MTQTSTEIFSSSNRDRLVEALVELSVKDGFGALSAETVVEHAGLEMRDLEKEFGREQPLERIMLAAENDLIGRVMSAAFSSYSADRSEWDSGIEGVKAILELMAANPTLAFFGYITVKNVDSKEVREAQEAARRVLAAMVERMRENSSPDAGPLPANVARAAVGSADALVRREIAAGRAEQLPRLLPDLIYGGTVAFLGQEEALRLARRSRELLAGTGWA